MKYYVLEPEVAGGFGPNGSVDTTVRPPRVDVFDYEFDVWLGDPILEAIGCYIVTETLKKSILALDASGVSFGGVMISKSGEFEDRYPGRDLPKFAWLQVTGKAGIDDFGMSEDQRLVVSQRILDVLKQSGTSHCDIEDFSV